MRILANENIPDDDVTLLRLRGHDVAWIRTDSPGASDDDILVRAVAEQRILLTFDKDFGELVFHRGQKASCGIVLFRYTAPFSRSVALMISIILESRTDWAGHFSVVDNWRIRITPLPGN